MEKDWKEILEKPGKEFRSAPFWAWNEKINEKESKFQIQEMCDKGMGGFFIHSREGLETPYLSEEWMAQVGTAVQEAKEKGLEVWIYDEDKWPSGCAGGLVSHVNPKEYSAKGLTMEVLDAVVQCNEENASDAAVYKVAGRTLEVGKEYADGKILGIYTIWTDGYKIVKMAEGICGENNVNCVTENGIENEALQNTKCQSLILRREISGDSEWYNGYAPTDNLNPKAVHEFLELTHESYKKHFKDEFGKTIKGFFTDEPNCCDFYSVFTKGRPWITWTDDLPRYFREKRGYELWDQLPYLFYDGEGCEQIRHDYWRTIAELFQESYMKQIYEWCEKEGVELTGHMLYENDLGYQTRVCGAAMPQYKYIHRPGIDLLGEQTKEYLTVKQCASVAHQYGKKHTISETYGCTGWEFGFDGQKWLGDWQFVNGIDRRCQHLAQYSISGCRKRDYPPVFSYQTTWWDYNERMEDYFSRLSLCESMGDVVRKILVIHPMSSIWTKCRSSFDEDFNHIEMNMGWLDKHITDLNKWGEEYNRLAKMLMSSHMDFDFGDEMLIEADGKAEDGRFYVGQASYDVVIVPRVVSLFASTVKQLCEFSSQGGKILWVGDFPEMVEGSREKAEQTSWEKFDNITWLENYEELPEELKKTLDWSISVKTKEGVEDKDILLMTRKTAEGYVQTVVNNDRKNPHTVIVDFPEQGKVLCYQPWTNEMKKLDVQVGKNGRMRFFLELEPAQTVILLVETACAGSSAEDCVEEKRTKCAENRVEFPYEHPHSAAPVFAALGPKAEVRRTMENVLTLDRCSCYVGEENYGEETDVWLAQKYIREKLNMRQVYYNGVPQRYFWLGDKCETDNTPFGLKFRFLVKEDIEGDCFAVIEKSQKFKVCLDGEAAELTDETFMDHSMLKWKLPKLTAGEHTLTVEGAYTHEIELEDIFVIGDFAVDTDRAIVKEKGTLHFGDWTSQGYYHYPGSMIYKFTVPAKEKEEHRYILEMGEFAASLIELKVNGKSVAYLLKDSARRADITDYLLDKENSVELCVVGSPRNMFGPFHQTYTGCSRISWEDFRTTGRFYTPDYVLEPYGLMGQITISMR